MSQKLAGKVAVVTGASKGIGAAIARHLAQAGARVVVNYSSSREGAERVVKDIEAAGGTAVAIQANVSEPQQIERLFQETQTSLGPVDILVNNAGIYEFGALDDITPEHFHKQFNLNVLGLLLATQAAARQMQNGGSIINISSLVSTYGIPQASVYSATKAAVDAITRSLSKELGSRQIRVNSINPGMVETEGAQAAGITDPENEFRKNTIAQTPLGRIGQPDDIAPLVVMLASPETSWVTGEAIVIAGGFK